MREVKNQRPSVPERDILDMEQAEVERLLQIKPLTPENTRFTATKGGLLTVTVDGEEQGLVNVIRTFPFTAADEFLSVRTADDKQTELGMIEQLEVFDEATVAIIKEQLAIRYFMPKITKIVSVKEEYGHTYWQVVTDKGECSFTSPSGSASSVVRKGDRVIIRDSEQNRYEIEDIKRLSVKELKKLDLYL